MEVNESECHCIKQASLSDMFWIHEIHVMSLQDVPKLIHYKKEIWWVNHVSILLCVTEIPISTDILVSSNVTKITPFQITHCTNQTDNLNT